MTTIPDETQRVSQSTTRALFPVIVVLLIGADLVRHVLTVAIGPAPIVQDSVEYWVHAGQVVDGDWFQMQIDAPYRTPAYVWFIAFNRAVFGHYALASAVGIQHVALFATTLSTALACMWQCRNRWGFVAGYGLSLIFLTRLWCANFLLTETLFTLPFTLGMAFVLLYHQTPRARHAIAAGFFLGLATLVRPVPQLLVPVLACTLIISNRNDELQVGRIRRTRHAGLMLLLFGFVLLPCFVRNKFFYDEVFLTKLPAANKWAVAFRDGSGGDLPWPESPAAQRLTAALDVTEGGLNDRHPYELLADLDEVGMPRDEAEALMSQVSFDAIAKHPGRFAWKAFKRIVNYWRCVADYPPHGRGAPPDYRGQFVWRNETLAVPYLNFLKSAPAQSLWWNQLFSLAVWCSAFWLFVRCDTRVIGLVILGTMAYFCLLTGLVEIENYRYRMILEPLMIICVVLVAFGTKWNQSSTGVHE